MDKRKNNLIKKIDNFFFDLDGTLLNSKKEISKENLETIKQIQKQNKKISIATGRPYFFAKKEINLLNIDYPIISTNGALIYDPKIKKVIYFNAINKNSTLEIFRILVKNQITFLFYTTEQMFGYQKPHYESNWFKWVKSSLESRKEEEKFEFTILNFQNLKNFDIKKHNVVKFLIIKTDSDPNQIKTIEEEIKKIKNIYTLSSQSNVIDIMPQNSSKGDGLEIIKNLYNLDPNKTIVFGDEENDVSMFKKAKYSVAMGQSEETIKNQAIFTTSTNDEHGVAEFLKEIL